MNVKRNFSTQPVVPIIFHDDVQDSLQQIVYTGWNMINYNADLSIRKHFIVNHKDFLWDEIYTYADPRPTIKEQLDPCVSYGIYWAFGLLINPFKTKVLPIDIDRVEIGRSTDLAIKSLLFHEKWGPYIERIDLVRSSDVSAIQSNIHMYLKFKEYVNVFGMIKELLTICPGYRKFIESRKEINIRVSQKFYYSKKEAQRKPSIVPSYVDSYERVEPDTIKVYSNFTFPNGNQNKWVRNNIDPNLPLKKRKSIRMR